MGGAGAGHIMDMVNRMRQNRALLQNRKFSEARADLLKTGRIQKIELRKATPEEMAKIKALIREDAKREKARIIFVLSLTIPAVLIILYAISRFVVYMIESQSTI